MKKGRLYTILIATAFFIATVLSAFVLFSVNSVDVTFYSNSGNVEDITQELSRFKGKSLLFLDLDDVTISNEQFPDFYISKVEKSYPNVLKVEVKERRGVFAIRILDDVVLIDEDGMCIRNISEEQIDREVVTINLDGIDVVKSQLGYKLETSDDQFVYAVFDMAKEINLTDCIQSISVVSATLKKDAIFNTYSGVSIEVVNAIDDGIAKIVEAYNVYDQFADDYQKSFDKISVYKDVNGNIIPIWTSK